jgi:hypothetical protein
MTQAFKFYSLGKVEFVCQGPCFIFVFASHNDILSLSLFFFSLVPNE